MSVSPEMYEEIGEDAVGRDLWTTLDVTTGCNDELIVEDDRTLRNKPENAVRRRRIAREMAERESCRIRKIS